MKVHWGTLVIGGAVGVIGGVVWSTMQFVKPGQVPPGMGETLYKLGQNNPGIPMATAVANMAGMSTAAQTPVPPAQLAAPTAATSTGAAVGQAISQGAQGFRRSIFGTWMQV